MDSPPKFIYRANRDKSSKIQFFCNFSQVDLKLYLAWTAHFLQNSDMSITTLDFIRVEGGGVAKCSEKIQKYRHLQLVLWPFLLDH